MTPAHGGVTESTDSTDGGAAASTPRGAALQTGEYEYRSATETYDGGYLLRAVLSVCRDLGPRRILDLGCGNGFITRALAGAGYTMAGCDPSASGIAIATQAAPDIPFEVLGVDDSPARLGQAPFDAVISLEVIEHLFAPRHLPRFARQVLREDGHLVISTPYHGYLKNLVLSLLGKWDQHHDPLWDGGHIKFWSVSTLKTMVEAEGFTFERFVGAGRFPWLWKSMILVFRRSGPRQPAGRQGA